MYEQITNIPLKRKGVANENSNGSCDGIKRIGTRSLNVHYQQFKWQYFLKSQIKSLAGGPAPVQEFSCPNLPPVITKYIQNL